MNKPPSTNSHRTRWSYLRVAFERTCDTVTLTFRCGDEADAKALFERLDWHLRRGALRFTMFDASSDNETSEEANAVRLSPAKS